MTLTPTVFHIPPTRGARWAGREATTQQAPPTNDQRGDGKPRPLAWPRQRRRPAAGWVNPDNAAQVCWMLSTEHRGRPTDNRFPALAARANVALEPGHSTAPRRHAVLS